MFKVKPCFSYRLYFGEKGGEDREVCLWRINGFAPEHGDFPKNHFWEPVSGVLVLGMPVKWAFLIPRNEVPFLLFLGNFTFGKRGAVSGKEFLFWGNTLKQKKSLKNKG